MKPRTKTHKRVLELKDSLFSLTAKQKKWFFDNNYYYSYQKYKTITCLECTHQVKAKDYFKYKSEIHICPKCKKETKLRNQIPNVVYTAGLLDVKEEFQIIRCFQITKTYSLTEPPNYSIFECEQFWVDSKRVTVVGKERHLFSRYRSDVYKKYSQLEIRNNKTKCNYSEKDLHPICKIHPELTKRGFDGHFYGHTLESFLLNLYKNPKYEIILKGKQGHILNRAYKLEEYWPQIRLAFKHKYVIPNYSMWTDYIDLLKYFNKDVHSPKYLFVSNLEKEHNKYLSRKRRAELHKKLETFKKYNPEYQKRIKRFSNFVIEKDGIVIKPLKTIEDFFEEEIKMHHCVFTNTYFLKKELLVLTSFKEDRPLETIAYNLKEKKVYQSYGACNKETDHHDTIIKIVEQSLSNYKPTKSK